MEQQSSDATVLPEQYVFLSYSSHDYELAVELKALLQERGVRVWMDEDRMRPGSVITAELVNALDKASACVVLVTAASLSSAWVSEESNRAIHLSNQSAFRFPVIPVAVEGTTVSGFLANRRILQLITRSQIASVASEIGTELSTIFGIPQKGRSKTKFGWSSRSDGFERGDISRLSIFESVAAVIILITISIHTSSLTYLAILSLIAPFALLQSDHSRSLGIRWLGRLQWWTHLKTDAPDASRLGRALQIPAFMLFVGGIFVGPEGSASTDGANSVAILFVGIAVFLVVLGAIPLLLVRFAATLVASVRHPLVTLRAVPTNWKNLILCKDLFEEPEAIPGYLDAVSTGELTGDLRIANILRGVQYKQPTDTGNIIYLDDYWSFRRSLHVDTMIIAIPAAILLYAPYYSTRWALKSTAVIWAPLLWLSAASNGSTLAFPIRLKILAEDATSKAVHVFSWIAVALVIAVSTGLVGPITTLGGTFQHIDALLRDPLLQLCIVAAAIIFIGLHLSASRIHILYYHKTMPYEAIEKVFNVVIFILRLIVLFVLALLLSNLLNHSEFSL